MVRWLTKPITKLHYSLFSTSSILFSHQTVAILFLKSPLAQTFIHSIIQIQTSKDARFFKELSRMDCIDFLNLKLTIMGVSMIEK